jgi:hypothetical protein
MRKVIPALIAATLFMQLLAPSAMAGQQGEVDIGNKTDQCVHLTFSVNNFDQPIFFWRVASARVKAL